MSQYEGAWSPHQNDEFFDWFVEETGRRLAALEAAGFGYNEAFELTVLYLNKTVANAQPPISPDLARAYEVMGTSLAKMADTG